MAVENPYSDYGSGNDTEFGDVNPRAVHDSLVSRVAHNTGGYQPPLIAKATVFGALCRDNCAPKVARAVARKAEEDGDIFRWTDEETGRVYYGLDDIEALRDRIASHVEAAGGTNYDLIGIANRRIDHLKDDSDPDSDQ